MPILTGTTQGRSLVLVLSGDLTLEHAEEHRSALVKSFIDAERVLLRFEDVRKIDVSFLQLLCAAHRTFTRSDRYLQYEKEQPDELKHAADSIGFTRCQGCKMDRMRNCLWVGNGTSLRGDCGGVQQ